MRATIIATGASKDTTLLNSRPSGEHGAQGRCCWVDRSVSKDATVRNSRLSAEIRAQGRCCWVGGCPRTPRSVIPDRVRKIVPRGGVVGLAGVQGHPVGNPRPRAVLLGWSAHLGHFLVCLRHREREREIERDCVLPCFALCRVQLFMCVCVLIMFVGFANCRCRF